MLQDRYVRDGEWLFRWRSYVPLVMTPVLLISMLNYGYLGNSEALDYLWEFACIAVAATGMAIRIYAIGYSAPGTSGNSTEAIRAETVNTTGAYSVVRHPLYLGNFFMWLGVSMFPLNALVVLVFALVFWLYYERIIMAEEAFLRRKFGEAYEAWARVTPAFIPNFRLWKAPGMPFRVRRVLQREYSGIFAVILVLTLLEVLGDYVIYDSLHVDPVWAFIFGIGGVGYLTLRTIRHHTRLLDERRSHRHG
jgi:protein-S-isoprenylcysteine O-methyltransferase Ste14